MKRIEGSATVVAAVVALLLMGCGGGGGGGGGTPAATAVTLTNILLPTLPDEAYENGTVTSTTIPPFQVSADVQGDVASLSGQTIYVVVEDPDQFIERASIQSPLRQTGNALVLEPKRFGPKKGRYVNSLRIKVCLDPSCNSQLRGSPVSVPYDITVYQGLVVNSNETLNLNVRAGIPTQHTVTLSVPEGLLYHPTNVPPPVGGTPMLEKAEGPEPRAFDYEINLATPSSLRLTSRALTAGLTTANLIMYAEVQTPKGRRFRLEAQVPVRYSVAP